MASNFSFLAPFWPELADIGASAENSVHTDPSAAAEKLTVLAESVVRELLLRKRIAVPEGTEPEAYPGILKRENLLPERISDILTVLRSPCVTGDASAGVYLKLAFHLCGWLLNLYSDQTPVWNAFRPAEAQPLTDVFPLKSAVPVPEDTRSPEERAARAALLAAEMPLDPEEEKMLRTRQVRLEIDLYPSVNYALEQNGIPVIRKVTVVNGTGQDLKDLTLTVTASPEESMEAVWKPGDTPAWSQTVLNTPELRLNGAFLASLSEAIRVSARFTLTCGETVLCEEHRTLSFLPFDQWQGSVTLPEMICAFVTPNHPDIVRLSSRASELLGKWTGNPSLEGYQSRDPNRILQMTAAVYAAIQELNITYAVVPAGFQTSGQRIRMCDTILAQRMGNCLDLTLLYASVLESIGLNPLIILFKKHAIVGVWLHEATFTDPVLDDPTLLTKRTAEGVFGIAIVESIAAIAGRNHSFDAARELARRDLADFDAFDSIVDVRRSRASNICPLPIRVLTDGVWQIEKAERSVRELTGAPGRIEEALPLTPAEETPFTRMAYWERRLLDLSLHNTLINLHMTRSLIPIYCHSLDELEDRLSDGDEFSVNPLPLDWPQDQGTDFDTMNLRGNHMPLIESEFRSRRLRSTLKEDDLSASIRTLYRGARSAMEENGTNPMYVVLGLLKWFETPQSVRARYAPVILIPVEMVRKSSAQGYTIRLREEDAQINVTMLEKLKQDFHLIINGLDPLPQDEQGIDTRRIFSEMRRGIMEQKNWDILEDACLGLFSFSQFVMWNDIRNRSRDLARNKIVRSLMDGKLSWAAEEMETDPPVREDNVFLPLPADASQLYAIQAACRGESFVLHGPPGTGKSQTITALIANALAQGRSVLFVAEKMAALEVVKRRLDKIGIGAFCLELHSSKATRKEVLAQLEKITEISRFQDSHAYELQAQQTAALRKDLNDYAQALHAEQSCGRNVYELIEWWESSRQYPEIPEDFDPRILESVTSQSLDDAGMTVDRLAAAARLIGRPDRHPLRDIGCLRYSRRLTDGLSDLLRDYRRALADAESVIPLFCREISESARCWSDLARNAAYAKEMEIWFDMPAVWTKEPNLSLLLNKVLTLCDLKAKADRDREEVLAHWNRSFLDQDPGAWLSEYSQLQSKWLLARALGMRGFHRRLEAYSKVSVSGLNLPEEFRKLERFRESSDAFQASFRQNRPLLGSIDCRESADWEQLRRLVLLANSNALKLPDTLRITYCTQSRLKETVRGFNRVFPALQRARSRIDERFVIRDRESDDFFRSQLDLCDGLENHPELLQDWISWNGIASEAENAGLACIVRACENGLPPEDIAGAFRRRMARSLIEQAIDRSPVLSSFSGMLFDEKIAQFRRRNQDLIQLTQQEIYQRLASSLPNFAREASQSTEMGILQKAIRSRGRSISIRRLFSQIPNLLPRLCPCMLMSPMSAAQFLDPSSSPFDLVVFDEASQLPTCKAVGALARGKSAIIVGDPKQMPPTSFFAASSVDEDNLENEDLESILEDCLALNMPQTHLLWHYRSRHESLIAFSNRQFYDNRLYTFPSADDRKSRVEFVPLEGVFDRGHTRQNRVEAEAIVAEIRRRFADPEERGCSIGVVTFNISQSNLIEDLLGEACAEDPELEEWVFNSAEPLFIKNLENVQGDERDVILFSVGYGPDKDGRVSMNFGPLNRSGGWRRLNVAVTRAREKMIVYSTLMPQQINTARTRSEGVIALRAFLEYAQNQDTGSGGIPMYEDPAESGIEASVCAFLAENGYESRCRVGHSKFRVDIAVMDPAHPERYLLGILLDGENYASARTAYDREVGQTGVLRGLDWNLLRIWSVSWWNNREKEQNRILEEIRRLTDPKKPSAIQKLPDEPDEPTESSGTLPENTHRLVFSSHGPEYQWYKAPDDIRRTSEEFMDPKNRVLIRQRLKEVVACEAPIKESQLVQHCVRSCNVGRAGSRMYSYTVSLIDSMDIPCTREDDGTRVFWNPGQDPQSYLLIRNNGVSSDTPRDVASIPVREAVNAILCVLYDQIVLSDDILIREAAMLFLYNRTGNIISSLMKRAIQYAQENSYIIRKGEDTWTLTPESQELAKKIYLANFAASSKEK